MHREAEGFGKEMLPQAEVYRPPAILKFSDQQRQQVVIGNDVQEMPEVGFRLNALPDRLIIPLCFRCALVFECEAVFVSVKVHGGSWELGYTERYIGQLERGTKSPTLGTLADMARVFSTEVSTIVRAAERRQRREKR